MGDKTGIEWTDATWNPTVGCSIVSPGCTNCYAMKVAHGLERRFASAKYSGLTRVVNGNPVWTGAVRLDEAALCQPLRWKRGRRIFVNSMSDLFHEDLPDAAIDRVFAVMALAPQHQFQVLTKRAERMRAWAAAADLAAIARMHAPSILKGPMIWPLPNVWLGVSVEDQARADARIQHLLETPAAVRFLSCEPLLGPVDLVHIDGSDTCRNAYGRTINSLSPARGPRIDWVIAGGESGPGARPMAPAWARSLRDQCAAAGVAFHFKQWGEWAPSDESPAGHMERVGKKRAGRLLDGVQHDGFPA